MLNIENCLFAVRSRTSPHLSVTISEWWTDREHLKFVTHLYNHETGGFSGGYYFSDLGLAIDGAIERLELHGFPDSTHVIAAMIQEQERQRTLRGLDFIGPKTKDQVLLIELFSGASY